MKKITLFLFLLSSSIGFSQFIANSTFDADIVGWNGFVGTTATSSLVSWSSAEGVAAAGAIKFNPTANGHRVQSTNTIVLSTAGDYTFTAKVKGTAGNTIQLQVFQTSNIKSGTVVTLTGGWDTVTMTATGLKAEAINLRLIASSKAPAIAPSGDFFIDDVYFTYILPPGSIITTNAVGAGTVTKTPTALSYTVPTAVTLAATPTTHWVFNNWSGDLTGNTNPSIVNVDGTSGTSKTITANFVIDPAFDFNFKFDTAGDTEGWIASNGTATVAAGSLSLIISGSFPKISLPANFKIPTTGHNLVAVTLVNNSANTLLRVAHPNTTTGIDYTEIYIAPNTLTPITYTVDLAGTSGWTGDVGSVELYLRGSENTIALTGTVEFQEVKFFTGNTEKLVYDFNGVTSEDWGITGLGANIINVTGGNLVLKPSAAKYPKLIMAGSKVNSANANSVRITMTNQSTTDDQFRVILADGSTTGYITIPVLAAEAVYTVPLVGLAGWIGDVSQIGFGFGSSTAAIPGQSTGTGNFLINKIEFFFDSGLGVNTLTEKSSRIALYPNPARAILNISSSDKISSISFYDITGKVVLKSNTIVNDQINVSNLKAGIYLVRIEDVNKNYEDKKIVIQN
jgi:Secretion system C-terminal sorting domain/Divergent InlB B-repeat domain